MSISSFLRSEAKQVGAHLLWGIKHPATVRKASIATLTHVAALVAAFSYFLPHVSTSHVAAFTAVTGGITWLTTFLSSNAVVEATDDVQQAEA